MAPTGTTGRGRERKERCGQAGCEKRRGQRDRARPAAQPPCRRRSTGPTPRPAGSTCRRAMIAPEDWERFRGLRRPRSSTRSGWTSTRRERAQTPERFLRALYDATAGYDGDPKLADRVPDREPRRRRRLARQPDHRGADRVPVPLRAPRAAVLRQRAHRLHRRRPDHRHLEADAARAPLRAALHGAGAARRADRRHARLARSRRAASPSTSRPRTSARRCAASRSTRARSRRSGAARSRTPSCGASSCTKSAATGTGEADAVPDVALVCGGGGALGSALVARAARRAATGSSRPTATRTRRRRPTGCDARRST